jgi:hypothetical protein
LKDISFRHKIIFSYDMLSIRRRFHIFAIPHFSFR